MLRDIERSLREALWPTTTAWWEVPDSGYVEVVDVAENEDALGRLYGRQEERLERQAGVVLVRRPEDRAGPDTVEVQLEGLPAGRLPPAVAAAWSPRLAAIEARGVGTRALADVSYRFARRFAAPGVYIFLRIADDPADLMSGPGQDAASASGGRDDIRERTADRDAERARVAADRAQRERQADEWRSTGRCAGCGTNLPARNGDGPTRAFCLACRPPRVPVSPATYANRSCPYCSQALAPLPTADIACPRCAAPVYVRWGPDGLLYLLQAVDLGVLEEAWRDWPERQR